jgi:Tat protein secretion system quality control protein TatD with DNase activity
MPIYPKRESVPADLWQVLEKIAELKKLNVNYVGEKIYDNSKKFIAN